MSQKQAKKLRKLINRQREAARIELISEIVQLSFKDRMWLVWEILWLPNRRAA